MFDLWSPILLSTTLYYYKRFVEFGNLKTTYLNTYLHIYTAYPRKLPKMGCTNEMSPFVLSNFFIFSKLKNFFLYSSNWPDSIFFRVDLKFFFLLLKNDVLVYNDGIYGMVYKMVCDNKMFNNLILQLGTLATQKN